MESYRAAKERLFTELLPAGGVAVLNADVPEFRRLAVLCQEREQRIVAYGNAAGLRNCASCTGCRARSGSASRPNCSASGTKSSCRWSALSRR